MDRWRRSWFEWNTHSTVQENRVLSIYSIFLSLLDSGKAYKLSKLCEWFFILNYFNSSDSAISLHFMEWPKVIVNPLSPFCTKSFLEQRSFINVVIISFENVDFFHAQLVGLDVCLDFPLHNFCDLLAASETLFEIAFDNNEGSPQIPEHFIYSANLQTRHFWL